MKKEQSKAVSILVVVDEGEKKMEVELHSAHGLFGVHPGLLSDFSLSKKVWTVTHIPSGYFIFVGIPWLSAASRIAKDLNQLMMQGIIAREAKSSNQEIALSAFPGSFKSYLTKVAWNLAHAPNCKGLMEALDKLLAGHFESSVESPKEQQTLFN